MRLNVLLAELAQIKIAVVGTWELNNRTGIILGDPSKYFPYPTGPQYPLDLTNRGKDAELTQAEVDGIRRRFGLSNG
jgi:hypothetical protein